MTIYRLGNISPDIDPNTYVAPSAAVIGQVRLEAGVSVWPSAVLRGDNDRITIRRGSNIQDGAVLHVDGEHPLDVGENVTIGHAAVLHGCTIGEGSLIGIHATILNGAVIGSSSIVGAGSVIPEGKTYPARSLILGAPGKVVRQLKDEEVEWMVLNARHYVMRAAQFRDELTPVDVES
ncbi:gamma carbonic anhydrase family protein [Methylobacterium gnaphalii]|uniref:gamma carbonic anhydrase family protein n=1 Tax=Methylobacterium gnaphalii TaxID=1010610 RepID=UPI0011BF710A|nr:gamma carbonic anhydrase family protein [Methylobacterium gnaphalii]GJD70897.1 Protein YrdA [Methylobacterium gnaphalii]